MAQKKGVVNNFVSTSPPSKVLFSISHLIDNNSFDIILFVYSKYVILNNSFKLKVIKHDLTLVLFLFSLKFISQFKSKLFKSSFTFNK